jgi:hypothetical protein
MTSPSTDSDAPALYATEMRWMMDDPIVIQQCALEFIDDAANSALLHSMAFVTQTIARLENELRLQREEFEDLFKYTIENPRFRRTMRPIVRHYRRRMAQPYSRTNTPPSLQSDHTSGRSPSPSSHSPSNRGTTQTPSPEPSQTVEIHSQTSNEGSSSSYGTANDNSVGTRDNPIDVEAITPNPITDTLPRAGPSRVKLQRATPAQTRRRNTYPVPTPCPQCTRTGHTIAECIFPGPLLCNNCRRPGHTYGNCPLIRSEMLRYYPQMQYCQHCKQSGHMTERCFHAPQ